MAMDLVDPTAQTWVFPAAAGAVNESSGIFIPGNYDLVGAFWEAMQATTNKMHFEVSATSLNTADASATWVQAFDDGGTAMVVTQTFTAAGYVSFNPGADDMCLRGPVRVRLEVFSSDGTTPVNQDGEVVTPVLRERK